MTARVQTVNALSIVAMLALLVVSIAAIILDDGGAPYAFTSARGEVVELYGGQGPYRFDTTYKAVMFRGFDWVNLIVVLPLFVLGLLLYRRRQPRGGILLAALFIYLAYIYLIGVMGNAFNGLFLGWTLLFSLGLFGLWPVLTGNPPATLPQGLAEGFPRKPMAIYVMSIGTILLAQYLVEIVGAYAAGTPPASLDHYTTLELAALELGVMIPLHFIGGAAAWRQKRWGYVLCTALAFTTAVVFIALSASLVLLYRSYGQTDVVDLAITVLITLAASCVSLVIFQRIGRAEGQTHGRA
jgi:hypothetical protein